MIPDRVLNPEEFRALIAMHGMRVRYYRAFPCPCRNPATGDFARDCALLQAGECNGAIAYREQTLPGAARVYFDRAKKTVDDSELGLITVGDMMAYAMPDEVPLERGDRLVVLDWFLETREVRQRGDSDRDALIQKFPFAIDNISWLDGADWVDGASGTDASLVKDGNGNGVVVWSSAGNAPPEGQNYTIIYRYRPTVFVGGASFMPSRASVFPKPGGSDADARYGLPIRALMSFDPPQA